jgi:predicted enzyme related to lactoylglutathione lyase
MPILGLKQAILYVTDMQAQVEFFRDVLGLSIIYPQLADYSQERWVEFAAGQAGLALHYGGQRNFGADSPCLVFAVNDIATTHAELAAHGVKVEPVFSPTPGTLVAYCWDPEGNRLALKQLAD